jgi:ABC-type lipoprotein export system ATPase subunit
MELIRLQNITKTCHLGEVDVPVLGGISLSIARGQMAAVMGHSLLVPSYQHPRR